MFNPRNGIIAVSLIGAGLALNVMMSKKKEKKKVIEKDVTVPIVQKKQLEPKRPQQTTFERYLKTKETSGKKQMCDYCDKMNMSPSEYSSEVTKSKDTCHSCGKVLSSKDGAVISSASQETKASQEKEEEEEKVVVELSKEKMEDEDDRKDLTRQVALQATLAASMGILAGVSYHIIFDRRT